MLIFQTDSVMCGNAPASLNDYLEWDWIGAWHDADLAVVTQNPPPEGRSYNGGFSLRKKEKTIQILRHCAHELESEKYQRFKLEDIWYEICYHEMLRDNLITLNLPPGEVAHTFSIQHYFYPEKDHRPLGAHKPWPYITDSSKLKAFAQYCPEFCGIVPQDKYKEYCT